MPGGTLLPIAVSRSRIRLFLEADDLAVAIEPENAHRRGVLRRHRQCGDRDVGVAVDVRIEQPPVVHPVEMIARENQVVVGRRCRLKCRAACRTASAVP